MKINKKAEAFLKDLYKLCSKHNVSIYATYLGKCRISNKDFNEDYDKLSIDLKNKTAQLGGGEDDCVFLENL